MTTPVPVAAVGPLQRALVEALESVAARDQVRGLLRGALLASQLESVPEEVGAFRRFVDGALAASLDRMLGAGAAEMVSEQLSHVLRLVAPAMRRQATGTSDEDADELSGERSVESIPPAPRSSGVGVRRPDIAAALRPPGPAFEEPLSAPALFRPRPSAHESGTQRKSAIARVSSPSLPRGSQPGVDEVRGPRSGARVVAREILVVSLDASLALEIDARLGGQSRVTPIATVTELTSTLGRLAGQRIAVVLDTGVPSIDVPTFASLAPSLPAGARVVLWGTDERQKRRLGDMFPEARAWVASNDAESPAELLLEA